MKYLMPTQTQMWPMHFQTLWSGNVRKMTIQFVKCGPCWIGGFLGTREKETKIHTNCETVTEGVSPAVFSAQKKL